MTNTYIRSSALSDLQRALSRTDRDSEEPRSELQKRLETMLEDHGEHVELRTFVGLLEDIGQQCKSLAWSAGLASEIKYEDDLGRTIAGCRSLGSALHWMCRFFPLLQDASSLQLTVDGDWAMLNYKILDPTIWPRHEDAMYTLGIYSSLIKKAAPDCWNQVQITVEVEAEQIKTDLSAIVQTPVVYGGSVNAIRFPASLIDKPLNLAPPTGPAAIKKLSRELTRKTRSTPITDLTRQTIFIEMNDGCVSQEHVARALGISSRTLRRRLADEDQSFQSILDECRMQFATLEFRTRRRLSLSDMALKLGYSEHSTFSRAFSRWSGMAPQEYRRAVSAH